MLRSDDEEYWEEEVEEVPMREGNFLGTCCGCCVAMVWDGVWPRRICPHVGATTMDLAHTSSGWLTNPF